VKRIPVASLHCGTGILACVVFASLETKTTPAGMPVLTKSSFLRAPRRFFASVGQTIGFRRLPCHGQKPKKTTV